VISVGNLQAGGTGKTPLITKIAREAVARGKSVCILSRGYKGSWEKTGGIITAGEPAVDAQVVGDEAALLHDLVPEAWIAVGRKRVAGFNRAARAHGKPFDLTLLDDGFQHWKIKKDLEILAITSHSSQDVYFRDFETQARRADLMVWTKGEKRPPLLDQIEVPSIRVNYRLSLPDLKSPCWLVSAIGDPAFFRKSLERLGAQITNELRLSDHDSFESQWVAQTERDAALQGAKIVMTGKDWVKWRKSSDGKNVLVLEPELEFENAEARLVWENTLWR
jgi:tetraacyldisaccharide 4'-kinase